MREQKTDVVYQCTVVSSWATFVTSSIILVIAVVVLFSVERDLWLPALFPEFFFLLILIGNYFSGYGILTITSDRVILSRFHRVITEFRLDEITAAGYFVRLKNRDEQLFSQASILRNGSTDSLLHAGEPERNSRNRGVIYPVRYF